MIMQRYDGYFYTTITKLHIRYNTYMYTSVRDTYTYKSTQHTNTVQAKHNGWTQETSEQRDSVHSVHSDSIHSVDSDNSSVASDWRYQNDHLSFYQEYWQCRVR